LFAQRLPCKEKDELFIILFIHIFLLLFFHEIIFC
jgi:hypothetical protein